jgi:hypothetical protein
LHPADARPSPVFPGGDTSGRLDGAGRRFCRKNAILAEFSGAGIGSATS